MKQDKNLMRLFKVDKISHLIVKTPKGDLYSVISKDDEAYHYELDAIPVDKETAEALGQIYGNGTPGHNNK